MTPPHPVHTERSTLAACIAHVAGASAGDVPLDGDEQRAWLAERGLGLVPVADAAAFSWAGPWIARRPARDGSGPRAAVLFGVPPGAIWDPAQTADEILDGFVVAPLDPAAWPPRAAADAGVGVVEALVIAPTAEAPVVPVDEAIASAGRGLQGDRYAAGAGTFASGRPGSALTLVDAAVLDSLGRDIDHRRNVVVRGTDLNALVGRDFFLGQARAVACASRARTSIVSTAAASCAGSCTAADCAQTSPPTAPSASAIASPQFERRATSCLGPASRSHVARVARACRRSPLSDEGRARCRSVAGRAGGRSESRCRA